MRNIHIDYHGPDEGFQTASHLARKAAMNSQMQDPTIISWHRSGRLGANPPAYEGANPETWWEKFGEGNGGTLEVSVGDDYQFIMMDAHGYETVDDIPLRNLMDNAGNQYLCYTSAQGKDVALPRLEACVFLDGWLADQY